MYAYTEYVPEGLDYVIHKKSRIMHKVKLNADTTNCKTRVTVNFEKVDRVFSFQISEVYEMFHQGWKQAEVC